MQSGITFSGIVISSSEGQPFLDSSGGLPRTRIPFWSGACPIRTHWSDWEVRLEVRKCGQTVRASASRAYSARSGLQGKDFEALASTRTATPSFRSALVVLRFEPNRNVGDPKPEGRVPGSCALRCSPARFLRFGSIATESDRSPPLSILGV